MADLGWKTADRAGKRPITPDSTLDSSRPASTGKKKVLLVITGREGDRKSFDYALSIAQRTETDLEVLTTAPGGVHGEKLDRFQAMARRQSVGFSVSRKKGCIKEAVLSLARKSGKFLCVVIESADALRIGCSSKQGRIEGVWEELGCPLALVSEKT